MMTMIMNKGGGVSQNFLDSVKQAMESGGEEFMHVAYTWFIS